MKEPTNIKIKIRNKYSITEKLEFIKLAEEASIHQVSNKYSIERNSIRGWIKQKEDLLKASDNNK